MIHSIGEKSRNNGLIKPLLRDFSPSEKGYIERVHQVIVGECTCIDEFKVSNQQIMLAITYGRKRRAETLVDLILLF